MSGSSVLLDTNVVLYLLAGDHVLASFLRGRKLYISFVTQLELLGYFGITKEEKTKVVQFINECLVVDLNGQIKDTVIAIEQEHRVKLPDSIVAATAHYLDLPLVTADTDFKKLEQKIEVVFYQT
jgi:predicted nucleic acid-binding protein